MRSGKKTGLVLVIIAILYFFWILAVTFHEAGYLLEDTNFVISLVEWAVIGIALYLCIIIIICMFYFIPTWKPQRKDEFKLVEGVKNQVACSNCKTIFSFTDKGERPLEICCPNCEKKGLLRGKTVSAKKQIISCNNCGNIFEILDEDIRPLEYECPECHHNDCLP